MTEEQAAVGGPMSGWVRASTCGWLIGLLVVVGGAAVEGAATPCCSPALAKARRSHSLSSVHGTATREAAASHAGSISPCLT